MGLSENMCLDRKRASRVPFSRSCEQSITHPTCASPSFGRCLLWPSPTVDDQQDILRCFNVVRQRLPALIQIKDAGLRSVAPSRSACAAARLDIHCSVAPHRPESFSGAAREPMITRCPAQAQRKASRGHTRCLQSGKCSRSSARRRAGSEASGRIWKQIVVVQRANGHIRAGLGSLFQATWCRENESVHTADAGISAGSQPALLFAES